MDKQDWLYLLWTTLCLYIYCTGHEKQNNETYEQEGKIAFVVDAVYTLAHALHNLQRDACNGTDGLCPALDSIDGYTYLQYVNHTSFKGKNVIGTF